MILCHKIILRVRVLGLCCEKQHTKKQKLHIVLVCVTPKLPFVKVMFVFETLSSMRGHQQDKTYHAMERHCMVLSLAAVGQN